MTPQDDKDLAMRETSFVGLVEKRVASTPDSLVKEEEPLPILQEKTRAYLAKFLMHKLIGIYLSSYIP